MIYWRIFIILSFCENVFGSENIKGTNLWHLIFLGPKKKIMKVIHSLKYIHTTLYFFALRKNKSILLWTNKKLLSWHMTLISSSSHCKFYLSPDHRFRYVSLSKMSLSVLYLAYPHFKWLYGAITLVLLQQIIRQPGLLVFLVQGEKYASLSTGSYARMVQK